MNRGRLSDISRMGLPVLYFLASSFNAGANEVVDATSYFDDWSAFFAEEDCWVATLVDFGANDSHIEVYFMVSFFRHSTVPHFSVMSGSGEDFADAPVAFVGGNSIEFEVFGDVAFPSVEGEGTLLRALRADQSVELIASKELGAHYKGNVATSGFHDAYNFIARECEFNFNEGLSDQIGVEPA